jgi:uncharacterized protein
LNFEFSISSIILKLAIIISSIENDYGEQKIMFFKRKVYDELKKWKEKYSGKYAALIEGPRRVGKRTVAEEFAKREYRSYIRIDFEHIDEDTLSVFDSITDHDLFFLRLRNITQKELYERESVIIFNEIQLQPKVRQAIKYLVADGRYDYIETGSMLSIKKIVKNIVIPSEEHRIRMYPMDWEEFQWATCGEVSDSMLRTFYDRKIPLGEAVNRAKMRDYRIYMAVGGMPQAVEAYMEKASFMEIDRVKREIISLYEDDFSRIDESGRILRLFESIPAQLARGSLSFSITAPLKTTVITDRSRELVFDLISSRAVLQCRCCTDPSFSLSSGVDPYRFKLYLADNGLFVSLILKTGGAEAKELYAKLLSDSLPSALGYLYENAVATTIASSGRNLYYTTWRKENSTHSYELDFLVDKGTKIIPVNCQNSRVTSHSSIDEFRRKYPSKTTSPVIFSQKDYRKIEDITRYPFHMASLVLEKEKEEC